MARAAHIGDLPNRAESTNTPNVWLFTYPVFILATEVGQLVADFQVAIDIVNDTGTQIEVKRRDAFIAAAPSIHPLFTNWDGQHVFQCQLRRN